MDQVQEKKNRKYNFIISCSQTIYFIKKHFCFLLTHESRL